MDVDITVGDNGRVNIQDASQHISTTLHYQPTPSNPFPHPYLAKIAQLLNGIFYYIISILFVMFAFPAYWVIWKLRQVARCLCVRDPPVMPDNYDISNVDSHTSSMVNLVIAAHQAFQRDSLLDLPVPPDGLLSVGSTRRLLPGIAEVPVPSYDYTIKPKPPFFLWFVSWIHRCTPMTDINTLWRDRIQATHVVQRTFGRFLAPIFTHWRESTSDQAFRLFCFQGMCSQHLMRVGSPMDLLVQASSKDIASPVSVAVKSDEKKDEAQTPAQPAIDAEKASAEEEMYVIRMNALGAFEVREGHQRYGGDAYFDKNGKPLYIDLLGEIVKPGDPNWEYAKFVVRSSAFVHCTLSDHLFFAHFTLANVVTTATRRFLPGQHPLHRLLTPFMYRTITINYSATQSLVPEKGIMHRSTGYTYKGLLGHVAHAVKRLPFYLHPPHVHFAKRQTDHLPGHLYPYAQDALDFYNCIGNYVLEYVTIYWKTADEVKSAFDGAVLKWWKYIIDTFPNLNNPELSSIPSELTTIPQVVEMITSALFVMCGFHQHVGVVQEYVIDPWFLSGRIVKGIPCAPAQCTFQMCMVASLTGFKMPMLMTPFEEFAHLYLDANAVKAMATFQHNLSALSARVDARNSTERLQPFMSFNPGVLECSVSV